MLDHDAAVNGNALVLADPAWTARPSSPDPLLAALKPQADLAAIRLTIDGAQLEVAFRVDADEHRRRREAGSGAATSTGLLHALWSLPRGVAVTAGELPDVKVQRLRATKFADECGDGFLRQYEPAGIVVAIAVAGSRPKQTIDRATRHAPVFQRVAVLRARPKRSFASVCSYAATAGVGLVIDYGDGVDTLVVPPPAVRGVPGVLRWWLAELAYREWLQESTQPVSCGFGS